MKSSLERFDELGRSLIGLVTGRERHSGVSEVVEIVMMMRSEAVIRRLISSTVLECNGAWPSLYFTFDVLPSRFEMSQHPLSQNVKYPCYEQSASVVPLASKMGTITLLSSATLPPLDDDWAGGDPNSVRAGQESRVHARCEEQCRRLVSLAVLSCTCSLLVDHFHLCLH